MCIQDASSRGPSVGACGGGGGGGAEEEGRPEQGKIRRCCCLIIFPPAFVPVFVPFDGVVAAMAVADFAIATFVVVAAAAIGGITIATAAMAAVANITLQKTFIPDCLTVSGPNPGARCVFPFTHSGRRYSGCPIDPDDPEGRKRWCSTRTDAKGNHVPRVNYIFLQKSGK